MNGLSAVLAGVTVGAGITIGALLLSQPRARVASTIAKTVKVVVSVESSLAR